MEKLQFVDPDTEQNVDFYVLEQTAIGGNNYLLVTVDEEGDSDAFILKERNSDESHATYELVEDEKELEAIAKIFTELMDDEVDFQF